MGYKIEYLMIKRQDDFFSTEDEFLNLLQANSRIKIKDNKIRFSGIVMMYSLEKEDVPDKKEIIFHFTISAEKEDQIQKLEKFDDLLRRINTECGQQFVIDTIWDDVSIYHTQKLYPQMVEIENLLRKLIYRFMIKTVGMKWFEKTSPAEFKKAIANTAKNNDVEIEELTEDHLYYADFIQLCEFLFDSYPSRPKENLFRELKKAVDENEDVYKDLVEAYEPRSNWDRYFAEKIQVDDLNEKWRKLYGFRNQVAHAKRMRSNEYDEAKSLIDELKPAFTESLEHVADVILTEDETRNVTDVAKGTISAPRVFASTRDGALLGATGYYRLNSDGSMQILPYESRDSFKIDRATVYLRDGVFTANPKGAIPAFATVTHIGDPVPETLSPARASALSLNIDESGHVVKLRDSGVKAGLSLPMDAGKGK